MNRQFDDVFVFAHWPPPKPEPKPKKRPRPLTGLPAMMHDLMEAADRHDRLRRAPDITTQTDPVLDDDRSAGQALRDSIRARRGMTTEEDET